MISKSIIYVSITIIGIAMFRSYW